VPIWQNLRASCSSKGHAVHREEEAQRERDEVRLGPELLEVNSRLLEQASTRHEGWSPATQVSMFE
jgi:hypothetical protein